MPPQSTAQAELARRIPGSPGISSHPALYIPGLDGLRAIAFLIVFVAHSMPHRDLPGGFGVTIFFFLSGYLITTLLRAEAQRQQSINLRNFYLRRLLRIFPPCYVTVLIVTTLAACGLLYNTESYKSLVATFLYFSNYWNILGLGNLPAGMGVLWSLAVEEHYYLLFPALYAWFVRASVSRKHQAACLIALCAGALAWRCCRAALFHSPWENIYEGTDTRFDSILYGCILAIVANPRLGDRVSYLRKHANAFALAGTLLIAVSFAYRNPFFRDTFRYTLQGIGLAPIFFLVSLPQQHFLTRRLEWPVLRWLGQLSYSMYLIHHALFHHFYHYRHPSFLFASGILVATILYAQALRTLIELPLLRARARLRAKAICTAKPASKADAVSASAA
jgi:peptidoglycan/LPS O-acetylase OafA/YrhL